MFDTRSGRQERRPCPATSASVSWPEPSTNASRPSATGWQARRRQRLPGHDGVVVSDSRRRRHRRARQGDQGHRYALGRRRSSTSPTPSVSTSTTRPSPTVTAVVPHGRHAATCSTTPGEHAASDCDRSGDERATGPGDRDRQADHQRQAGRQQSAAHLQGTLHGQLLRPPAAAKKPSTRPPVTGLHETGSLARPPVRGPDRHRQWRARLPVQRREPPRGYVPGWDPR